MMLELDERFGQLVVGLEQTSKEWLIDEVVAGDGLTAITGASKTGRTSLAISLVRAMMDPKVHGGWVL